MARNLGPKSARILRSVGISTMDEVRRVGAVRAYSLARAADAAVSLNLLWALEGATSANRGNRWPVSIGPAC